MRPTINTRSLAPIRALVKARPHDGARDDGVEGEKGSSHAHSSGARCVLIHTQALRPGLPLFRASGAAPILLPGYWIALEPSWGMLWLALTLFLIFSSTTSRVRPSARSRDCLGIFVTNG